jgi:hypothetical protein
VNEGYKQSYGVVDPQSEAVHLFGGDVDVDRSIVDLQGPEARASQVEMKVRSMRLTLEAALINGDATANQGRGWLPDTSQVRDSRDSQLRSVTVG